MISPDRERIIKKKERKLWTDAKSISFELHILVFMTLKGKFKQLHEAPVEKSVKISLLILHKHHTYKITN